MLGGKQKKVRICRKWLNLCLCGCFWLRHGREWKNDQTGGTNFAMQQSQKSIINPSDVHLIVCPIALD